MKNSLLDSSQKFTCIDKIAQNYLANQQYHDAILLLTNWVEENPDMEMYQYGENYFVAPKR